MVQQIEKDLEFDCNPRHETIPEPLTPEAWYEEQLEDARWGINYHTKEWAQAQERNAECNAWIKTLLKSLPEDQNQGQGEGSASSSLG